MGYQNFFATKLFTDIGASDTTITLETVPTTTSGRLVLEARNPTQREIIKYTGVSGNQITGVTRGAGGTTAKQHLKNSLVEMNATAQDLQDLYDAFNTFSAAQNGGWLPLAQTPTVLATHGNSSFDISIPTDLTSVLSKGTKLRIPRSGSVPTQSTELNGTNQNWSKTSPVGMTFTDDFVAGAWIKLDSYPPTSPQSIISRFNGTSGWSLQISGDGTGSINLVAFNGSSNNYSDVRSTASIPLGRWVHVAVQLDMSAYTGTPTTSYVMIDGIDSPCILGRGGTNPTSLVQAGNLEVGSRNNTNFFAGTIAQPWVSSTKITQSNIRSFMYSGLTPAVMSANSIVSGYSFDGVATDLNTSSANNLTSANAAGYVTASPFDENAYVIIMTDPVFSAGSTTMTVQAANGYSVPNTTLGAAHYSVARSPYKFPGRRELWQVVVWNARLNNRPSPVANTWYNNGDIFITVPKGDWLLAYKVKVESTRASAGAINAFSTLGLTSSDSLVQYQTNASGNSMVNVGTDVNMVNPMTVTSPTVYYLNQKTSVSGLSNLYLDGSQSLIRLTAEVACL